MASSWTRFEAAVITRSGLSILGWFRRDALMTSALRAIRGRWAGALECDKTRDFVPQAGRTFGREPGGWHTARGLRDFVGPHHPAEIRNLNAAAARGTN
ncbi:hypothetical protein GCM10020220_018780 [Nonomuraea rubra]